MFKFDLKQYVTIEASGESGYVIGQARYDGSQTQYQIRYKCADGSAVESWWSEDALRAK